MTSTGDGHAVSFSLQMGIVPIALHNENDHGWACSHLYFWVIITQKCDVVIFSG